MFARSRDPETGESVYLQISRVLEQEIRHQYRSGDFLPSENVLADRFGVNRHTLRRAIDELIDAGVVERRRGRGTLVLDPAVVYPIHSRTRFTDTLESQGRATDTIVVFKQKAQATEGVAAALDIAEGQEVVWLEVLRLVDNWPFSVVSSFMPYPRFADLLDLYNGGSLHSFAESHFGLTIRRKWSRITAVMPRTEDAHRLKTPRNKPLLRIKSMNIDADTERPVEYCVSRVRSDRVSLEINP